MDFDRQEGIARGRPVSAIARRTIVSFTGHGAMVQARALPPVLRPMTMSRESKKQRATTAERGMRAAVSPSVIARINNPSSTDQLCFDPQSRP